MLGHNLKTYAQQLNIKHASQLKADIGVFGWEGDIGWFDVGVVSFWKEDLEGCLREASHGKRLIGLGNHDDDFHCCAELDQLPVVPTQLQPGVLCAG